MANPQVEKLKALGLRHGEKAGVGIAGALCVFFLYVAATRPTIEVTPDEVDKHASSASQNLQRRQNADTIIAKIEADGIKNPGFEKIVDAQSKDPLVPEKFKAARLWVTNEPGAGLIRDKPVLIAPEDLYAYPGRGGASVFALDEEGKRVLVKEGETKVDESSLKRRRRKRRRNSSMMGGMGMGGGMGMMGGGQPKELTEKEKRAAALEAKIKAGRLAGDVDPKEDEKSKDEESKEGTEKEVTRGLRWVVITGVLDHKKLKANYLAALKLEALAHPHYRRLDLQRQARNFDGTWPGDDDKSWVDVDSAKNQAISFNLPETEDELAPDDVLFPGLVDPLPFLKTGLWERVHVARLVPKEKRETKPADAGNMGGMMGGAMMGGGMGMMGGRPGGMSAGGGGGMGGMGAMGDSMPGMRGSMGGMGGFGGMGGSETVDWKKSDRDTVMVRALDYTVEPDTTYRFRVRIVVFNPNYKREDVLPGIDTEKLELEGPWSEPTDPVTMPADVTPYVMDKDVPKISRPDQFSFQVVRWDPVSGVTVTKPFSAGPGEIIGDLISASIPSSTEGKKAESKPVDFVSRQLVLDAFGGSAPVAQLGLPGSSIDMPALSLLLRPDGTVAVRNEFSDRPDPVRKDIDANYKRELSESGKNRESSTGSLGMGGMMPGGRGSRGGGGMAR